MINDFSELLRDLLRRSGLKNRSIAEATGYDISYISKWLSGKMLPSEKAINQTIDSIADCISSVLEIENNNDALIEYGNDKKTIRENIAENLLRTYQSCKNAGINYTQFFPYLNTNEVSNSISKMIWSSNNSITIIDFFSLNKQARLAVCGIADGSFLNTVIDLNKKVSFFFNAMKASETIYDSLSLIHLISGFSIFDFTLYSSPMASNVMLEVTEGDAIVSGILFGGSDISSSVAIIEDKNLSVDLYKKLIQQIRSKDLVCIKRFMSDFVNDKGYLKSLLSTNIRWLLGHITELLMPDDLFRQLLEQIPDNINKEEAWKIHNLSKSIIEQDSTKIMFYETGLSDFLATKEVDFFNNKIRLEGSEIIKYMDYFCTLCDKANFKLIESAFYCEFEHLNSPCLYLSDTACYLKIENAYERKSIYQIVHNSVKSLLDDFFPEIWKNRKDVVIDDKTEIKKRIVNYRTLSRCI